MLNSMVPAFTLAALFIAGATPARAQFEFGLSAGKSMPQSTTADEVKLGSNVNIMTSWSMPLSPVGFRAELGFNRFTLKRDSGKRSILDGAANLVLSMPSPSPVRPYAIAGIGVYNVETKVFGDGTELVVRDGPLPPDTPSQNHAGFNGGAGVSLGIGGLRTMVEARYVHVTARHGSAATRYVPISFGLMFSL